MVFNNDYILKQVILKGSLPDGKYSNAEILDVAYDQLLSIVMPFIIGMREEFFVRSESLPIQAGLARYPFPDRAHNLVLREIKLVVGSSVIDLTRLSPEEIQSNNQGTPKGFYLEDDSVVLYPAPQAAQGSLLMTFFQTPSSLVEVNACARITANAGGVLSASIPTEFTPQETYDIVAKRNGHKIKLLDLTASSVTDTEIAFAGDLSEVEIGDYVCLSKTTPFPQVPDGVQPWLIMLTVTELLESMESLNSAAIARGKAQMLEQKLTGTLGIRVQGAPKRFRTKLI